MLRNKIEQSLEALNYVIVGKSEQILLVMSALLAQGHVLLEDVPGVGKTTLAKALSCVLGLDFKRIQFTADLLPSDVLGFNWIKEDSLVFNKGAIFTQLLLADEINRASAKTQSALLEAMEEKQVSIDHKSHMLPEPFFVIATQNPTEQVGTYPLPESQLDRFWVRISLGYPDEASEINILLGDSRGLILSELEPILHAQDILDLQKEVEKIHVSQALASYVRSILHTTRKQALIGRGLSPRAGLGLIRLAKAYAYLQGDRALLPKHVQAVFPYLAWHRLHNEGEGTQEAYLNELLQSVAVPV